MLVSGLTSTGGTWRMVGIPNIGPGPDGKEHWEFPPPCYEPGYPNHPPPNWMDEGQCTGVWMTNITIYDYLRVPEHLTPCDYVLGFRWDCESSAQVWQVGY